MATEVDPTLLVAILTLFGVIITACVTIWNGTRVTKLSKKLERDNENYLLCYRTELELYPELMSILSRYRWILTEPEPMGGMHKINPQTWQKKYNNALNDVRDFVDKGFAFLPDDVVSEIKAFKKMGTIIRTNVMQMLSNDLNPITYLDMQRELDDLRENISAQYEKIKEALRERVRKIYSDVEGVI